MTIYTLSYVDTMGYDDYDELTTLSVCKTFQQAYDQMVKKMRIYREHLQRHFVDGKCDCFYTEKGRYFILRID